MVAVVFTWYLDRAMPGLFSRENRRTSSYYFLFMPETSGLCIVGIHSMSMSKKSSFHLFSLCLVLAFFVPRIIASSCALDNRELTSEMSSLLLYGGTLALMNSFETKFSTFTTPPDAAPQHP